MRRSNIAIFFLVLGILLSLAALVVWVVKKDPGGEPPNAPPAVVDPGVDVPQGGDGAAIPHDGQVMLHPDVPGMAATSGDPGALVAGLVKAMEDDDRDGLSALLAGTVDAASLQQLEAMVARQRALGHPLRVREVGEIELNTRTRWAIEFGSGDDRRDLLLDLRSEGGKWMLDKVMLPLPGDVRTAPAGDALAVAGAFVQAVLTQKFEDARGYVDGGQVTDARIAGLCILFEEGAYRMRDQKPLRAMFLRDEAAGFIANVVAADGSAAGQFAMTLVKGGDPAKWLVSEVNLDQLLDDYAERVAGGDAYYSPLVKNPKGGETLALYFGFDEDEMSPRTRRQLEIVAAILKADPVKKLTLSGHTDAKGTDAYNRELSHRRAVVVRDFLVAAGVHATQVEVQALGASQPRRPNVTETGADNPQGRRANRRTEIYLDF